MHSVVDIEEAVTQLPEQKFVEFRDWFEKYDEAKWDKQINDDSSSGILDTLAAEAIAEYNSGNAKSL